jgi:hypothetical protein
MYLYIIECDDSDFSNLDSTTCVFEIKQWKTSAIPKNTTDIYGDDSNKQNKFIVYRKYMNKISIEELRNLADFH